MTERPSLWHYEYVIGHMLHHFDAHTFEACIEAVLDARGRDSRVTGVKIFKDSMQLDGVNLEMLESSDRDRIAA